MVLCLPLSPLSPNRPLSPPVPIMFLLHSLCEWSKIIISKCPFFDTNADRLLRGTLLYVRRILRFTHPGSGRGGIYGSK